MESESGDQNGHKQFNGDTVLCNLSIGMYSVSRYTESK